MLFLRILSFSNTYVVVKTDSDGYTNGMTGEKDAKNDIFFLFFYSKKIIREKRAVRKIFLFLSDQDKHRLTFILFEISPNEELIWNLKILCTNIDVERITRTLIDIVLIWGIIIIMSIIKETITISSQFLNERSNFTRWPAQFRFSYFKNILQIIALMGDGSQLFIFFT